MSKYWTLSNINLYKILCPTKVTAYDKKQGHSYSKDDVIYAEHEKDSKIYMVSQGKVKIVNYDQQGNEVVKQILVKGELFGEDIILSESAREEFAVSGAQNTKICAMNLSKMRTLMRDNELFATTIYKFIGFKFRKVQRRLELLVGKDVDARIACFIYDLYQDHENTHIKHNLSQKDIANLLATSRQSVATIFNRFRHEGIIEYTRKDLTILDLDRLKALSLT